MKTKIALLILSLVSSFAAGLENGIKVQYGASANVNHVTSVTITGETNVNAGSYVASNVVAGAVLKTDANKRVTNAVANTDFPSVANTITGNKSLTGGGSLAASRTIELENDATSPGANKVYGTDGSGVRGWKDDPAGGGSVSVNSSAVENPDFADSATLTWGVVGSTISATVANLTAAALATDSVSADELNAAGVETELEGVLDLQDLQGAVTDAQVPDTITVDLATVATTANAGDSATAFFSSGEIEDARLPSALARDTEITTEMANVVKSSGSSVANDIAVFTDTTRTNIARSTSAANFGDSSSATFTVNFGLSGATDPTITAGNNSLTFSTPVQIASGSSASDVGLGFSASNYGLYRSGTAIYAVNNGTVTVEIGGAPNIGLHSASALNWAASGAPTGSKDTYLSRASAGNVKVTSNGTTLGGLTAGTLTLTPASADTTAVTVSGGSTTGSGTTKAATFSHTANTSGNIDGVYTFTLVDTASGASTFHTKWLGGAAGTTVLMSLDKNGNSTVLGNSGSSGTVTSGNGFLIGNSTRGGFHMFADGAARFRNNANNGFTSITLGPDDSSPNDSTIYGSSGSGSDISGGDISISGGASTGNGPGGHVKIQTSPSGSTGTSANAYSERAHWIPKAVTLTESTATTVATIAVPSAKFVGGSCTVTVFASDATDHQARTLTFPFSAINKAGTVTAGLGTPVEGVAVSSGTLTATITTVANGNAVDIKVDATSSLTQTTLSATVSIPAINSNDTAAVTEI